MSRFSFSLRLSGRNNSTSASLSYSQRRPEGSFASAKYENIPSRPARKYTKTGSHTGSPVNTAHPPSGILSGHVRDQLNSQHVFVHGVPSPYIGIDPSRRRRWLKDRGRGVLREKEGERKKRTELSMSRMCSCTTATS